jgi:hypothetical protein
MDQLGDGLGVSIRQFGGDMMRRMRFRVERGQSFLLACLHRRAHRLITTPDVFTHLPRPLPTGTR